MKLIFFAAAPRVFCGACKGFGVKYHFAAVAFGKIRPHAQTCLVCHGSGHHNNPWIKPYFEANPELES